VENCALLNNQPASEFPEQESLGRAVSKSIFADSILSNFLRAAPTIFAILARAKRGGTQPAQPETRDARVAAENLCRVTRGLGPSTWDWMSRPDVRPFVVARLFVRYLVVDVSGWLTGRQREYNSRAAGYFLMSFAQTVDVLIEAGWNLRTEGQYLTWAARVGVFLETALGLETAGQFRSVAGASWSTNREAQIGFLEGVMAREERTSQKEEKVVAAARVASLPKPSKRVFVVHGHDEESKQTTARFLEHIGLEPTILHEQPNSGRTIIEKFELHADVGFAVVLLTPDDVAHPANAPTKVASRARQNVILELGYFIGRLTRGRVCALYKPGVEIPSDYQGVLYVELDPRGGWRTKLAHELVGAGFSINLGALLK
jgi:predicted nucleotide-binding protein